MQQQKHEVSYYPDNCLRKNIFGFFADIIGEIHQNKWLTYQLFKRDLNALYKQSIFGFLWIFVNPLFYVGTFIVLRSTGTFAIDNVNVPYPIYAVFGMSFWQLFTVSLTTSSNSLVAAGSMITKINFSKKSLVLASISTALISFIIQFILMVILLMAYKVTPSPWIILSPLFALPILFLSLGFGFIVSLLNAIMRDIGNSLPMLINFLLLLTPILYPRKDDILGIIAGFNPIYYLVTVPRDVALNGDWTHINGFLLSSLVSFVFFLLCCMVFHLTETRIAERV